MRYSISPRPLLHMFGTKQCGRGRLCMRRETNNDRQQRLFVTGLLISAVVGALIGLLWPLWFPAILPAKPPFPMLRSLCPPLLWVAPSWGRRALP